MQKKISVIIPAYNTEKWIAQCLQSVVEQTYQNLEILIVNDGSTDQTGEIADRFAAQDSRIKVFHQENAGVSASRNFAIGASAGELLSFIDSDDYIDSRFFEKLADALKQENADMAISTRTRVFPNGSVEKLDISGIRPIVPWSFRLNSMHSEFDWSISCNKLYNRELFVGLCFPEEMHYAEDLYLLTDIWKRVRKAVYVHEGLYFYRFNPQSASFGLSDEKLAHRILATNHALDYVKETSPVNIPFLIDLLFGAYVSAYCEGTRRRVYLSQYRAWFRNNFGYCVGLAKAWAFYIHPRVYFFLRKLR